MAVHRQPPRFSDAEDDSLLNGVSGYPALFDPRHEDFKNAKVKADLWDSVSADVGRDVETCKRRWKDIKDNYFKIKRQHKMGKCRWSLVGKLSFLDNVEPERRGLMPYEADEREAGPSRDTRYDKGRFILPAPEILMTEQEYRDSPAEKNGTEDSSARKRRYEEVSGDEGHNSKESEDSTNQACAWTQEDDVDLFMKSIALQLKKLSPRKVAQGKVTILTAINELQFGQMQVNEEPK